MEAFLIASKACLNQLTNYKRVKVVLGNCTCDLDSTISALVEGFFHYHELGDDERLKTCVIPLMNTTEKEFRVKTEVVWFLKQNGIPPTLISFRNQIDLHTLAKEKILDLVLVDHHTLPGDDSLLVDSVVEIIDHRPQDPSWLWPGVKMNLDQVGSCATLVANNIITRNPNILDHQIRSLLRGPILVDTQNFSEAAARAKPLDQEVIRQLENTEKSLPSRESIYEQILAVKTDISCLTPADLLIKDLKVVDDVAVPGFPILVEKFMELPNALEDVLAFSASGSFTLVILLGMDLKGEKMRRDVGVFVPSTTHGRKAKITILSSLRKSILGLRDLPEKSCECSDEKGYSFALFHQENVRATRKQILPIIQSALAELRSQC